jgi:hypothetical protein
MQYSNSSLNIILLTILIKKTQLLWQLFLHITNPAIFKKITTETSKYVTMIIVVDDGSHGNTAELAISKSFINFINRSLIKSTINDIQSGFCAYRRSVYN